MIWITMDEKLTHRQDARPYWVGTNAAQQRLRQEGGKIAVLYLFRKNRMEGPVRLSQIWPVLKMFIRNYYDRF